MANYPKFKLTTNGVNLLNRVIAEKKTLKFTKFEIGEGDFSGDIKTLESLVSKFKDFAVIETNVLGQGQTNIKGYFDNKGLLVEKRLKEIGIYAQIGDEILTEVLFSYTNAGDTADLIPSETQNFFSRTLSVINKTDDVENITFNVDLVNCKRDFNTVAELKSADWLIAGDKVNLWGNLALGDVKKTSKIITNQTEGIPLLNGLYAKDYVSFLEDGGLQTNGAKLREDDDGIWGGKYGGGKIEDSSIIKIPGYRYYGADGKAYICNVGRGTEDIGTNANVNNITNYTACNVVDNLGKLQNLYIEGIGPNGTYRKWHDGTLECFLEEVSIPSGAFTEISLPHEFKVAPKIKIATQNGNDSFLANQITFLKIQSSASFNSTNKIKAVSQSGAATFSIYVKGIWK